MMKRPTIPDLAAAAGVSVSTVNRVINNADEVRQPTRERVLRAAQDIGFYGLGSIEYSVRTNSEKHRLGVLLQQQGRPFYKKLGEVLREAAENHQHPNIELKIEFLEVISPDNVAAGLIALSQTCDAVAVVAAEHPLVSEAIDSVLQSGIPVVGLITPLSATGNVGFVGLDNWKVGRTAAWAFDKMVKNPGKVGILVGNHRYRNQELNESGFRSYFREHNTNFTLLEPVATHESAAVAREMTEKMLDEHPDLCGLFVSGGGISGVLPALRRYQKRDDFVTVGYELFDVTRNALIDGTLSLVISHPLEELAHRAISIMIMSKRVGPAMGAQQISLGFDIYTSENV